MRLKVVVFVVHIETSVKLESLLKDPIWPYEPNQMSTAPNGYFQLKLYNIIIKHHYFGVGFPRKLNVIPRMYKLIIYIGEQASSIFGLGSFGV